MWFDWFNFLFNEILSNDRQYYIQAWTDLITHGDPYLQFFYSYAPSFIIFLPFTSTWWSWFIFCIFSCIIAFQVLHKICPMWLTIIITLLLIATDIFAGNTNALVTIFLLKGMQSDNQKRWVWWGLACFKPNVGIIIALWYIGGLRKDVKWFMITILLTWIPILFMTDIVQWIIQRLSAYQVSIFNSYSIGLWYGWTYLGIWKFLELLKIKYQASNILFQIKEKSKNENLEKNGYIG